MKYRIKVLISGNGSNLQALIDARKELDCEIVQVISNRLKAYGLQRAKDAGISTSTISLVRYKKQFEDQPDGLEKAREAFDAELASMILKDAPDVVVCAGWMHILSPRFLDPLREKGIDIINLHPALPGQFNGANAIERAYEAWQQGKIEKTGVMIHRVIPEVDMGSPLVVQDVLFRPGETLQQLEERIHEVEHVAIVNGTKQALREKRS